jgi:hypothetical protein
MDKECTEVLSLTNITTYNDLIALQESTHESAIIKRAAQICYDRKQQKAFGYDGEEKKSSLNFILDNMYNSDGGPDPDAFDHTMSHYRRQHDVLAKYHNFQWPKPEYKDNCQLKKKEPFIATRNPTQNFLLEYFTPSSPQKGMLLWHSVGSGKTCTVVNICSGHFEQEKYRIIYVNRPSLKTDIYKNVFNTVCHNRLQDMTKITEAKTNDQAKKSAKQKSKSADGLGNYTYAVLPKTLSDPTIIAEVFTEQKNLLDKTLWTDAISYKQFGNLCVTINNGGKDVKSSDKTIYAEIKNDKRHKNDPQGRAAAQKDPLYKTLIVIDEAHYLFKEDKEEGKRYTPDTKAIHKAIMRSYQISGKDSVKILLLTATPVSDHPYEFLQLMNLLRPESEQIRVSPSEMEGLLKRDIDQDKVPDADHYEMLNFIAKHFSGYVSYLNRSDDYSQFAQTKNNIHYIDTDMTPEQEEAVKVKLGLRKGEKPTSFSMKPQQSHKGNLPKTIRDILSPDDYMKYYKLIEAKTNNSIANSIYADEIRRLFTNYPDVIELHLGASPADGTNNKKVRKSKKNHV